MKKLFVLFAAFAFAAQAVPCQAWENIGEMPNPLRSFQENSPNYKPRYYDRTFDTHESLSSPRSQNDYNDAPHGHDIRDYNPYYDRYGNRKPFEDR